MKAVPQQSQQAERWCPFCSQPITDRQPTGVLFGLVVHERCDQIDQGGRNRSS